MNDRPATTRLTYDTFNLLMRLKEMLVERTEACEIQVEEIDGEFGHTILVPCTVSWISMHGSDIIVGLHYNGATNEHNMGHLSISGTSTIIMG